MSAIVGSIIATQFEEMFSLIQAMHPKNVKITGGAVARFRGWSAR